MQPLHQTDSNKPNQINDQDREFLSPDKAEALSLEERANTVIQQAQADLEKFTKNDQAYRRKDTVEVVIMILERVKEVIEEINQ